MKRFISVFLSICMIFSVCAISFSVSAADVEKTTITSISEYSGETNKYPFIFVHGMMGWGEDQDEAKEQSYWGYPPKNSGDENGVAFPEGKSIVNDMRARGYTCATVSVGGISSAWDRACELYAQLAGTVVDYGEAHSKACKHDRYGRDYTGRSVLETPFDIETDKVNIITHSFGGPAGIVFASLLEKGSEEEIAASGADVSPLFKGGHEGGVFSLTTLASPTNGTPLANLMHDTVLPLFAFAFMMNYQAVKGTNDPMLDQYGLSVDPTSGEEAKINLKGIIRLATADDNCAYDMTLRGAKELNEKFPAAKGTYYFSYNADVTEPDALGIYRSTSDSNKIMKAGSLGIDATLGTYIDGTWITKEWTQSDGLVPVVSARYPFNAANAEYEEGMSVEPGTWYYMPTDKSNLGHGFYVAYGKTQESADNLENLYDTIIQRVIALEK